MTFFPMWRYFAASAVLSIWSVLARFDQQSTVAIVVGLISLLSFLYGCYLIWTRSESKGG